MFWRLAAIRPGRARGWPTRNGASLQQNQSNFCARVSACVLRLSLETRVESRQAVSAKNFNPSRKREQRRAATMAKLSRSPASSCRRHATPNQATNPIAVSHFCNRKNFHPNSNPLGPDASQWGRKLECGRNLLCRGAKQQKTNKQTNALMKTHGVIAFLRSHETAHRTDLLGRGDTN